NHCGRGAGLITIGPSQGDGSLVEVEIDHGEPRGLRGRVILGAQERLGPVAFPRMCKRALDRYAANGG
ncbi:MAG: Polyketide cyclase / dehydrase and lipid transport, partial [Marmoricola sp.]|nr:Polyketide cyclase / dehydrase and lipid transport [Marmoricola sp.]